MATRAEHAAGIKKNGEMNGKRFAESVGVAHGTVKRWLHEGMPCSRKGHQTWIVPSFATAWVEARYGKTVAFDRRAVIYFAVRDDGAVKIGWSSDIVRRVTELRRDTRSDVQLLACYPGAKPDELALHARFATDRIEDGGEWFRRSEAIDDFLRNLARAAA